MSSPRPALNLRYAARCETGSVRPANQDAAYASPRLLAVADGGGGPGGAAASAAAVDALKPLELLDAPAAEQLTMLADAVAEVDRTVQASSAGEDQPISTLTAILRSGSQLALVHVGDTRAYLLRDGELVRLTHDHTYVQSLVDQGKLTADEAAAHPQRALLIRALGVGGRPVEADLALRGASAGDRYLLCSDGLHTVVDRAAVHAALSLAADPEQVAEQLVRLAYDRGAPDNIACVVADVVPA
jgi:serine/threonine protein phosphatase PrpC